MNESIPPPSDSGTDPVEDALARYRPWLYLLARIQTGARFQGKFDVSDVVQQAMLEAVKAWPQFRGRTGAERRGLAPVRSWPTPWRMRSAGTPGPTSATSAARSRSKTPWRRRLAAWARPSRPRARRRASRPTNTRPSSDWPRPWNACRKTTGP